MFNYDGSEVIGSYNDDDVYLFKTAHSDGADYRKRYQGHRNHMTGAYSTSRVTHDLDLEKGTYLTAVLRCIQYHVNYMTLDTPKITKPSS